MSQQMMPRASEHPSQVEGTEAGNHSAVGIRAMFTRLSTGERVIGGASVVLLVALFVDWISVSCSGEFCGFGSAGGAGGMHGWGWLTFVGLLGVAALLAGRRVVGGHVTLPELPASDAVLYMAVGGVEVAGCLLFWLQYHGAFTSSGPFSVGLGLGWPLAVAGGAATIAGGYLIHSRDQSADVAVPTTSR